MTNILPPFAGKLVSIKIVETGGHLNIQPLDCSTLLGDISSTPGNFNSLCAESAKTAALAAASGRRFFTLIGE